MENLLVGLDFRDNLILHQVSLWMDGGSVTLNLTDTNYTAFTVEFCQIMFLTKHPQKNFPGSFLLNKIEIPIRSDDEQVILNSLKHLSFSDKLIAEEKNTPKNLTTYREIINERIAFVESEEYLVIAKKMGRL
ncbi:hypothetical protein [Hymenobacter baengnokdamensis]|uniref:hypothetical protein n=1 Tax=Hymenobacter baengnokdamensis TaxID=2615203 RepID=UPI001246D80C|nr:hypothetical protein [Hymenobacter baengnokdamensis]